MKSQISQKEPKLGSEKRTLDRHLKNSIDTLTETFLR